MSVETSEVTSETQDDAVEEKAPDLNAEFSDPKIQEKIPLAEDMAVFRSEIESTIFNAPRSEWRKVYENTLAKYPQLLDYKPLFDSVSLELHG